MESFCYGNMECRVDFHLSEYVTAEIVASTIVEI
jgi:hypothetical protein